MKTVRFVSSILRYITMVVGFAYSLTFFYVAISLLFNTGALNITEGGTRFEIFYPFTQIPFLLGIHSTAFIMEMMLAIGLYGVFLLLVSNVFNTFRQPKLFTEQGIKRLRLFYLANLIVPILVILLFSIVAEVEFPLLIFALVHGVLGIFAYFLAAIFKQGVLLQKEQDLYI